MKPGTLCMMAAVMLTSWSAATAELQFSAHMPSVCVATPLTHSVDQISVSAFCNGARGGTIFAVGTGTGLPLTLSVGGTVVELSDGQRIPLFRSIHPFREQLTLRVIGDGAGADVNVFLEAVAN